MPALAVVTTGDPPLSGARAQLSRLIAQLAAARAHLEETQQPAQRLAAVVADLDAAERQLATLRAADADVLGAWLVNGGTTARPQPSPATLAAEQRLINLRQDAGAAQSALPAAESAVQRAVAVVQRLQHSHGRALLAAAVEAVEAYIRETYHPAMVRAVRLSAPLESLKAELMVRGSQGTAPDPAARAAAMQIDEIIRSSRDAATAEPDPGAGRRLLDALSKDAGAEIEVAA